MNNKHDLQKKTQEIKDDLVELHKKSGLPGAPVDFTQYQPAILLCEELLKNVPEFRQFKDFSVVENGGKSDPYMFFGIFGRFLAEQIERDLDSDMIKRALQFIDHTYKDSDENIRTMIGTEIFENLTVTDKTVYTAKENLTGETLESFTKFLA